MQLFLVIQSAFLPLSLSLVQINNNHQPPPLPVALPRTSSSYVWSSTISPTHYPPYSTPSPNSIPSSSSLYASYSAYHPFKRSSTASPLLKWGMRPTPISLIKIVTRPPLEITSVFANHHRPSPEKVKSDVLTVLDPDVIGNHRLHPNTTVIHNKLIVPYKPGRAKPPIQTPQSGFYPVLAGVTRKPFNFTGAMEWIMGPPADNNSEAEVTTYYPQTLFPPRPTTSNYPWTGPTFDPNILQDFTTTPVSIEQTSSSAPVTTTVVSTTTHPYPSLNPTQHSAESVQSVVTRKPYYPSATVNAILAPPMPSRPISTPAPIGNTGIFSNLMGVLGVDNVMNRLTLLKTALFTLLVMFLPPLTLAAAVAQLL